MEEMLQEKQDASAGSNGVAPVAPPKFNGASTGPNGVAPAALPAFNVGVRV